MCTENDLNVILQELVSVYQAVYGEQIVKILLYGSYARGDYDSASDIDVVALVHGERGTLQKSLKQVWDVSSDLELKYGTILSPAVIPYEEYIRFLEVLPYYQNIEREGVEIVA